MSLRRRLLTVAFLAAVAAVSSALAGGSAFSAKLDGSESSYVGYPNSIAVLAHSGATGENSDPRRPGVEVRGNSWATGTNPAVNSVYLRILAKNPGIEGHNVNLAHGSATVHISCARLSGPSQSTEARANSDPDHGRDMVCPAKGSDYAAFRSTFISALKVLAKARPKSRFFVVSQFGSPTTEWKTLSQAERRSFGGTGPCAFLDPAGRLVPKELARLEGIVHGYEAQLEAACKRFSQCRYDGGAFGRIVNKREYASSDVNHWSVKGHAKAAAVAWAAMKRAGLVPRTG